MLFAFGSNGNGQLGIGNTDDQDRPHKCMFLCDHNQFLGNPVRIAAGGNHTLVLFDSGRLFSAGSNNNGQAGLKANLSSTSDPADLHTVFTEVIVPSQSKKVKLCSATWEASIIVTLEDDVYTFGSGPNGELGARIEQTYQPQKLLDFPPVNTNVVQIASGVRHTVVVLSNGEIYGWGNARKGQLGQEDTKIIWTPRKVGGLNFRAKEATCGREFTYVVGDPSKPEQLVIGSEKWNVLADAPSAYSSPSLERKMLGSSWCGISILDICGKLISWGRNERGQLAPKDLPEIEQIAVGSEHTIALTKDGKVLAWGWGEHGNCGPSTDQDESDESRWREILSKPPVGEEKVISLGAGCATSFIWTTCEKLW